MNQDLPVNNSIFDSKVTAVVSDYYLVSDALPFRGSVELLIEISVETESVLAYGTF
jgi:hypothetical protein